MVVRKGFGWGGVGGEERTAASSIASKYRYLIKQSAQNLNAIKLMTTTDTSVLSSSNDASYDFETLKPKIVIKTKEDISDFISSNAIDTKNDLVCKSTLVLNPRLAAVRGLSSFF
jgi:hypothetical protein